jgi:hypothetical protein
MRRKAKGHGVRGKISVNRIVAYIVSYCAVDTNCGTAHSIMRNVYTDMQRERK